MSNKNNDGKKGKKRQLNAAKGGNRGGQYFINRTKNDRSRNYSTKLSSLETLFFQIIRFMQG
jgi:hypothetical protein